MSKASMLKKLAARITTANGDISAVQGTSISEILEFMADNLNVDSTGALIVSKIIKKIIVDLSQGERETNVYYVGNEPFGLTYGKTYVLKYKIDGVEKEATLPAEEHASGKVYLTLDDVEITAANTIICDRASGRHPEYDTEWSDGEGFCIEVVAGGGQVGRVLEIISIEEA